MVIIIIQVANATNAVANVDDYSGSARLLAATTLRLKDSIEKFEFIILIVINLYLHFVCICMLIVPMDRNVLGTLNLGDILSQRESIAREMQVLSQPRVVPDREILNTKMGNTYVRMRNTFATRGHQLQGKWMYLSQTRVVPDKTRKPEYQNRK